MTQGTAASSTEAPTSQKPLEVSLKPSDRCDRCGAQAYLRVLVGQERLELLFCGHHADRHRRALRELARGDAELHDQLSDISRKPIVV